MRILAIILGVLMAANGVYMFVDPPDWYAAVPGVPDTGPLNLHFVQDIGIAYAVSGGAIVWGAFGGGWRATAAGAAFLALHSLLHIGETIMGHHHDVLLNEAIAVHLPAWLAVAIAYLQRRQTA
ncbi:MAG: hypothetical protein GC190_16985 [Alphaproteobacteria bacterium]|nr:hypothetical protein [Alphaproteobacteria bacterium]